MNPPILPVTLFIIGLGGLFSSEAYAYIDPASGTIIIQMMIGALVGVGITIKVYWAKIRFLLSKKH